MKSSSRITHYTHNMRFFVLLVAGAFATSTCKNAAGNMAQDACHTAADDDTAVACTAANCAFGTANAGNQWTETYDNVAEACRLGTALVAGDNCAYCKEYLNCGVDTWMARDTAENAAGWTDPATCGDDLAWYTDNAQPSCVFIAAWGAANMPTCADPAVAADLVDVTTPVYGPTDTTCTAAIADKCMGRVQCADYATQGPSAYVAATTEAPASGSDTSPAAIISAGVALVALLF